MTFKCQPFTKKGTSCYPLASQIFWWPWEIVPFVDNYDTIVKCGYVNSCKLPILYNTICYALGWLFYLLQIISMLFKSASNILTSSYAQGNN